MSLQVLVDQNRAFPRAPFSPDAGAAPLLADAFRVSEGNAKFESAISNGMVPRAAGLASLQEPTGGRPDLAVPGRAGIVEP